MKQITEQRPDLTYHCARRLHQQGTRGSSVSLYLSKLSRIVQLIGVLGSFTFVPSVALFLLHFYTGRVLFNLDNFVGQFFSQFFQVHVIMLLITVKSKFTVPRLTGSLNSPSLN